MYFLYYYMYLFIICVYGLFKLVQKIINKYLNIDTYYFNDCGEVLPKVLHSRYQIMCAFVYVYIAYLSGMSSSLQIEYSPVTIICI